MTLDDVVAILRARFTPTQAGTTVAEAKITAEEWNTLARLVYVRDRLEAIAADPTPEALAEARAEAARTRRDPVRSTVVR